MSPSISCSLSSLRPIKSARWMATLAFVLGSAMPALSQAASPTEFTFIQRTNVTTNAVITSEAKTVTGITGSLPVSVSGGNTPQYKIGGGTYTSTPGTITNGQTLTVRHTSASTANTTSTTTVTVGDYNAPFTSVTGSTDRTPEAFDFGAKTNTFPNTFVESDSRTLTGYSTGIAIVPGPGAQYSIDGGAFTNASGTLQPNQALRMRHVTSASALAYTKTYLKVGGITGYFTTRNRGATNQLPTANAGADQTVDENATVALDGSASTDAESTLSYAWTQTAGPTVTLNNANTATPGFTAPQVTGDQTLVFKLTVTDDVGTTAADTVQVVVLDGRVISIANASVSEGNSDSTAMNFTVSLSAAAVKPITVNYETANGTAVNPSDYAQANGTLNFAVGETQKAITVNVTGDTFDENDETFTVGLSGPQGATIGTGIATGTITNDDSSNLLRIGAAKRSIQPSAAQVAGMIEARVVDPRLVSPAAPQPVTHKQFFNLGGFGINPLSNMPDDPVGIMQQANSTLVKPVGKNLFTNSQGHEERIQVRAFAIEQQAPACPRGATADVPGVVTDCSGGIVVFLTIDAVGAGNLIQKGVKNAVIAKAATLGVTLQPQNILFGQTHSHAGPDLQGLWGGVPEDWVKNTLYVEAAKVVEDALKNRQPAHLSFRQGDTVEFNNYRRARIDPAADADGAITLLQGAAADGTPIGNVLQYNAHPTGIGAGTNPRIPHPDYILGAIEWLESTATGPGGVSLYYNGPIADASGSGSRAGCTQIAADQPYSGVRCKGEGMADYLMHGENVLAGHELEPTVESRSVEVLLPVTNPGFLAFGLTGSFNRYYNFMDVATDKIPGIDPYLANLPQATPVAKTTVSRITLGGANGLEIVTIPGEATNTFGQYIRGLTNNKIMFLGLTHNSFGYIVPEDEFNYVDQTGGAGLVVPGTNYLEMVSLGPLTAPLLRNEGYNRLFGVDPTTGDTRDVPPMLDACVDDPASALCALRMIENRLDLFISQYLQSYIQQAATACHANMPGALQPVCGVLDALVANGAPSVTDAQLALEVAKTVAMGCDFLDPANCLYPFPNDWFTAPAAAGSIQAAPRGTGRRVNISIAATPRNAAGKPVDPTEWNRSDGFSPGALITTYVPGLSLEQTFSRPSHEIGAANLALSQDPNSPILVLEVGDNGSARHLVWAEIDQNANLLTITGAPNVGTFEVPGVTNEYGHVSRPLNDGKAALLIRPGKNFTEGKRYVVVLRNLKDAAGNAIQPQAGFQACVSGDSNLLPVQQRCAQIEDQVFPVLEGANIDLDQVYLAWDFTVESTESAIGRLRHMRDDAFATLSSDPADEDCTDLTSANAATCAAPEVAITNVIENPQGGIARRIEGTITVPNYLAPIAPAPLDNPQASNVINPFCTEFPESDGCEEVTDIGQGLTLPNRLFYSPADGTPTPDSNNVADPTGMRYGDGLPDRNGAMTTRFLCQIPSQATPDNPARASLYGHGQLDRGVAITYEGTPDVAREHNYMFCAVDWFGFRTGDAVNVLSTLADLSNFPVVPDASQQGMLNFMFLARAMKHPHGLGALPEFQGAGGRPVFDRSDIFYNGNSQGGIFGGVVLAASKDVNRGVLGSLGMNYSTLLTRSKNFDEYAGILYTSYPDPLDRQLLFSMMQMLWDRSENNAYASHLVDNSAFGGPTNIVKLDPQFGDPQVTMFSAEVMARTMGVPFDNRQTQRVETFGSKYLGVNGRRHPGVDPYEGLSLLEYGSDQAKAGALVVWDTNHGGDFAHIPPITNTPPRQEDRGDPHDASQKKPYGRCHMAHFLRTGGQLIDIRPQQFDGQPCPTVPPPAPTTAPGTGTPPAPGITDGATGLVGALLGALLGGDVEGVVAILGDLVAGLLEGFGSTGDTIASLLGIDDPRGVWLRGDLHVHNDHSADGSFTRQVVGQGSPGNMPVSDQVRFGESQGLDFMAMNDHRTFDQHYDPLWTSDRLLLVTGEEANGGPHATVFGALDMINQADNPAGAIEFRKLQQSIWDAHAQGAAWSTAHPDDGETLSVNDDGSNFVPNNMAFATGVDLVEVWNRGTLNRPKIAYAEDRWNNGWRFGIAGASDSHFKEIWAIAGPGTPMTHVLSADRSTPALLDALHAGRTVINMGDRSPFVTLSGDFDSDGKFETVGGDERQLPAGKRALLRVSVRNGVGATVYVYRAPGEYAGTPAFRTFIPTLAQQNFDFPVTAEGAHDWYRVEIRGPGEVDALDYGRITGCGSLLALPPNPAPCQPQESFDKDPNALRAITAPIFVSTGALADANSPQLPADNGGAPEPLPAEAIFGAASDNAFAGFADVASANALVHTVAEVRAGSRSLVQYRTRLADGTYSAPVSMSDSGLARQPAVAAAGADVWVAWQDEPGDELPHNPQIFLRHSSDAGASWDAAIQVSASAGRAERPDLGLLDAVTPVVVWEDNGNGAFDVMARVVGVDAAPVNLSASGKTVIAGNGVDSRSAIHPASVSPKVAVRADGVIAVAWQDNRNDVDPGWTGHDTAVASITSGKQPQAAGTQTDDWEIFSATFNGAGWNAPVNVSRSPGQADRHAAIAFAADGSLHAAWDSKSIRSMAGPRLGIRRATSADDGANWDAVANVTAFSSGEPVHTSQRPVFGRNGDALSLFWTDGRSLDWRWRLMRSAINADGSLGESAFVTGPGNAAWGSYSGGWLAFTSDRSATREQRKPQQAFLLSLDASAGDVATGTSSSSPAPIAGRVGLVDLLDALLDGDLDRAGAVIQALADDAGTLVANALGNAGSGNANGLVRDAVADAVRLVRGADGRATSRHFRVGTGEANHDPKDRVCFGSGSMCSRSADPSVDGEGAFRDHLISKATAITGGNGETFILVTTSNIGYFLAYKAEQSGMNGIYDVRLRIAQATGVPSTNVTVVSDHSHSAPDTIGIWGGVSAAYMKITADAVVEAAIKAYDSRRDATIRVAAVNQNENPVSGVPRLDSSYDLPPGKDLSRGNPYNEFRMLVADDATSGERILTFVNYAPHATVTNGDKIDGKYKLTGDWAAWATQETNRFGGMGLAAIGTVGSTDWNKTGNVVQKEAEARARLNRLMDVATAQLQPVSGNVVQVESTFIREPMMQPALLLNYKPGADHNIPGTPTDGRDVRIDRSTLPPFLTGTVVGTYVSAIRIGDVFISTFPGEPFGELDHALKDEGRVQGARQHFLLGGANDFFGYMVKKRETYEQTLKTGALWLPGCPEKEFAKQIGVREPGENACSDHWTLMVSPTIGSHIVCTLQDSADRLGFTTANRDQECAAMTALDGLGAPPESGDLAAQGSLAARQAAVDQARDLAEQCRGTAAPASMCDALAEGARQAETFLGTEPVRAPGQAYAGVASRDASWHLGASAGQFSDTGTGIARDAGFDPYGHSVRKVGSDILGTRIKTRALVVEGGNDKRVAIVANDLYLPNDLLHRRTSQLLAEHDAQALAVGRVVTGITDRNLSISSSHSHTSPFYSTPSWGPWIFQDVMDLRFYEYMARQMADAVVEAAGKLKPVRMGGATVHANDVQAHTYGPKSVRDGTPGGQPRDYTTQAVTVVTFDDISAGTPQPMANWVIFGVHPEWVWGEEISNGDFTHAVMRMLDRETGAMTVWSQRETGSSGPHKDDRVHHPSKRREFQESNFAGLDRGARYLTDSIHRALGQLATNTPERPDQFAPYRTHFDVAVASQRFAPPVTRPYPGISNCNTDRTVESGEVGTPVVPGLPDCNYDASNAAKPVREPFWNATAPVREPVVAALTAAGVPVPSSYSAIALGGVQETAAVHLQVFKLGGIAALMSPNEQFTSQVLNLESRLDKVPGNLWHGFDWACELDPGHPVRAGEPANVTTHCERQVARYGMHADVRGSWNNAAAAARARAQVHNNAAGWELDPVWAFNNQDSSGIETLGHEYEPQDIAKIKGNFTHEEFTQNGYDLVVSVGMVNDYWGYMAEYREYRSHSDGYRKALNALGPHGADFVATRLARMAANLNGARTPVPVNPLDPVYQAESWRAEGFARAMGETARAYTAAYDLTLPADGGAPAVLRQPADVVKRFSAATIEFVGGSNYTDMPYVRVERLVSGTPANGVWKTYGDQDGEVQLQLKFLPNAFSQGASSPLGSAAFGFPDPQALAMWRAGQFQWKWTATFEAFVSELDNLGGRPGTTPAGTYRFVVDGQHRGLLSFPNASAYHLESRPFEVVSWNGITVDALQVEADGRVSFAVGPVNTFTTFKSGAGDGNTTRPGYTVGPVDYPDSYVGGLTWIRNERQLFTGDQQYCGRCTFRPWADSANLAVTAIPVTVRRADGSTYSVTATQQAGRWVSNGTIAEGDTAFVAASTIVDQYGETNGAKSVEVTRPISSGPDGDNDGVPDATDACPGTGPGALVDANGCAAEQRDTDGDGYNDAIDRFPNDPNEWADSDNDGIGDNSDQCPLLSGNGPDGCPQTVSQLHLIGSLHEHSGYSDGTVGTIPANYFAAGVSRGLDFMASSEHSDNAMAPVTANAACLSPDFQKCIQASPEGVQKWNATATQADAANAPGSFTAIRGFEWTSDRFGHINVFFSTHDLNAKTSTGYSVSMEDFWQWLAQPPANRGGSDGLAVFNHPGREDAVHGASPVGDPAYAWNALDYRPEHDARMVGIELYGKSSDYYDGDNNAPTGGWYAYALDRGWHVGPVGAEDEHGTSWATPQRAKTVMIAASNTRAELRAAMQARRFYALAHGHGDLRLEFSAGDLPMGSRLEVAAGTVLNLRASVTDLQAGNGVAANRIQIVGPGGQVLSTVTGLSHAFPVVVDGLGEGWRFVRVLDNAGKVLAVSAPIWFRAAAETAGAAAPGYVPMRGLAGCLLSQDSAMCAAALSGLQNLSACSPSQAGLHCAYTVAQDAAGLDTAAEAIRQLLASCSASPAAPVCEAVRSTGGAPDALAVASESVRRGDLIYTGLMPVPPSDKIVDGDPSDWMGQATYIGGTARFEFGEHVYSDFLFDAFGADDGGDARRLAVQAALGQLSTRADRIDALQQAAGDQLGVPQPAGARADRYGDKANREDGTDLTEVRWAADADQLYFLARVAKLETISNMVVVILADKADGKSGTGGLNAGLTSGIFDRALILDSTGGKLINLENSQEIATSVSAAVQATGYVNALEAGIPRSALERADGSIRVAVMTVRRQGNQLTPANVAYRYDEPVTIYSERAQAMSLFAGRVDHFAQTIRVPDLTGGRTQSWVPGPGYHERQFISGANISVESDAENGRLQPYGVFVPSSPAVNVGNQAPLTFWTHYRGGKAHSGAAWTPRLIHQLGEEQGNYVVTPRARGTSTWYTTRAHQDFFEVFADFAGTKPLNQYASENLQPGHGFLNDGLIEIDPARVYISGYSMGGFATYLFAGLYPDLFAGGYSTSGAVTQGAWTGVGPDDADCVRAPSSTPAGSANPCFVEANNGRANAQLNFRILDNTRHVPIVIHHGTNDELALTPGAVRMGQRLLELQYRYDATTFLGYEHFTQAIMDEWADGAHYLNRFARPANPRVVTYKVVPALVKSVNEVQLNGYNGNQPFRFNPDGAYWVDGLVVRSGADGAIPADGKVPYGQIDAESHAIAGQNHVAVPRSGSDVDPGAPSVYVSTPVYSPGRHSTPYVRHALDWVDTGAAAESNGFAATLTNLSAATLDLSRMGLRFDQPVEGAIESDGATALTLARSGGDVTACVNGDAVGYAQAGENVALNLGSGASAVRLVPGVGASCAGGPAPTPVQDSTPGVADVCQEYGAPASSPACASLRDAGSQLQSQCDANGGPVGFCSIAGGNLYGLIDACYDNTGGDSSRRQDGGMIAACRVADALLTGVAAYCKQLAITSGNAIAPQACALIGGRHVGEYQMQAYEGSWIHKALRLQNRLGYDLPLIHTSVVATHNSFNATNDNTPATLSGSDSNQLYNMTDQLRMGVRSLEIDVHWMPRRSADGTTLREPVVCHGTQIQVIPHVGCTSEKPLRQVLQELRPWLDANPNEAVLVYVEDNLTHNGDGFNPDVDGKPYESAGKVFSDVLGDITWKPDATMSGAVCQGTGAKSGQAGSWLDVSRSQMLTAGKQVLLMADRCSASGNGPAWDSVMHWKNTGNNVIQSGSHRGGVAYDEGKCVYGRSTYASAFTRVWEDSTMLTATDVQDFPNVDASNKDGPITPAVARELMRCGMHMPGLDQLSPFDGRLEAMVWSWAPSEPSNIAGRDCAYLDGRGRLAAGGCAASRPHACVSNTDPNLWSLSAVGPAGTVACPGATHFSVPANGYANERLKAAASGLEVWVNYRRDGSAFEGWNSGHETFGAGTPRATPPPAGLPGLPGGIPSGGPIGIPGIFEIDPDRQCGSILGFEGCLSDVL